MTYLRTPDPTPGWLSDHELEEVRQRVPMLYVEAVPVRTEASGRVTEVGLLLRGSATGAMRRTIVSGRVMYGEQVRDALMRHLEEDLGPSALPVLPASTVPFTVTEYFPWPGSSSFSDTRQHAVALAYVIPVAGECDPRHDALELTWMTPAEAASDAVAGDLEGGRGVLLRQALASVGCLP